MSVRGRKERERADRHRLIVSTARELAETHGWDAVTTRRLAELTSALRAAVPDGPAGRDAVARLARAYTDFAARHHALYDAMFILDNGLPFADEATPRPLREAFRAPLDPLVDHAGRLPAERVADRLALLVDHFVPRDIG
ncbi:WHG domain-containing protein [Streptomyces sp. NBC_01381]|uniref:TetR-like C-terminal domain-containing protein n=1 Tax=Streptomyces sp. NBC_01381 TaxID=2903845 RepID=UPI00224D4C21|nr:WHG domain-containing protein [Streptomyces sp. NBC_01381]MCX4673145.1 WHG domain-containing protein [Streptomyces sp. NBC_01381]